ncbi:MAG: hypothetical protein CBD25_002310 [Candidatus Pelagibacter sp. TMED165]|nr:MAG: hypothetical protein CBD25_002310 [Candidatus Pelagibacter sp. TMED165]
MLKNIVNLFLILCCILFFISIYKYYFSIQNITNITNNRTNIETNLKDKSVNLPILKNDTNDVIEFNSGFNEEINETKPRNFWNLLKIK